VQALEKEQQRAKNKTVPKAVEGDAMQQLEAAAG
jgi:hypothetical protein